MVEENIVRASYAGYPCTIEFSMGLGIAPGTGTATFASTGISIPYTGTLEMYDGIQSMVIFNVFADNPRLESDAISGQRLTATLYDRRYLWKWGYIVGTYNKRGADGVPTKEKTLAELIVMCLTALNEPFYDLGTLPQVYPEVKWEYDNPGNALDDLCNKYGLVIGMSAVGNNPIKIRPYNSGRNIPAGFHTKTMQGISRATKPSSIILAGNRVVCQRTFESLVAVGEDTDGTIKPIESLSYAPSDWGEELIACFTNLSTQQQRELAEKCIYKWYSIDWADYDETKVLPLLNELSDKVTVDGIEKHDKPYPMAQKTDWDGTLFKTHSKVRLAEGYQVDKKLGIVKFNKPVYKADADGAASGGLTIADVDLVAAYEKKDNTWEDFRTWERDLGGTTLPVAHIDSNLVSYSKFDVGTDILRELNTYELDEYANAALNQLYEFYQQNYPKVISYTGIHPEGAWAEFQSVTWRVGEGGIDTEIQIAIEVPRPSLPKYKERLHVRKIDFDFSRRSEKAFQTQQSISVGGDDTQQVSDGDISSNSMFGPFHEKGGTIALAENNYAGEIPAKSVVEITGYNTTTRLWEIDRPSAANVTNIAVCQEAIPQSKNGAIHLDGLHVVLKDGTVVANDIVGTVKDGFTLSTGAEGTHRVVKVDSNDLYVKKINPPTTSGGGVTIRIGKVAVIPENTDNVKMSLLDTVTGKVATSGDEFEIDVYAIISGGVRIDQVNPQVVLDGLFAVCNRVFDNEDVPEGRWFFVQTLNATSPYIGELP